MGSSAVAKLAWGIDFRDYEETGEGFDWADVDSYDFDSKVMPRLFSFTEEAPHFPQDRWQLATPDERRDWHAAYREPWERRRDIAIPLEFIRYGYEFCGTALVLKRSLHAVEWGSMEVDVSKIASPGKEEIGAFRLVLNELGFEGPVQLLLMAEYG